MAALELVVFGTIAFSVLCWAAAETLTSRALWTLGIMLMLVHAVTAFMAFYGGSHVVARDQTMRQTQALTGITFPGGIYVNYIFLAVWIADAAWWWARPASYATRRRWLSWTVRGFIFFVIFNGAVVFADGWARVIGGCAVAAVIIGATARWVR